MTLPDPLDLDRVVAETFVAHIEHHPVVGSTNDRARQRAAQGPARLPLLIVADRQTDGRGRGGNRWWTGPGSLAMSLLLNPGSHATRQGSSPLTGLAAAVAIVEAVAPLVPREALGLHWPNDVYCAGRKLAGVLVEVLPDRRRIVGIGINTNSVLADAPPELRETATTLVELTGRRHDPTAVLVALLRHFEGALRQAESAPEELASRADELCLQRGQALTVRSAGAVLSGRCAGIAPDGALLVETPQGPRRFYSGTLA